MYKEKHMTEENTIMTAEQELALDLERLLKHKQDKAAIEHEIEDLQKSLSSTFDKALFSVDNRTFKATVMRSETFEVDLDVLKLKSHEMFEQVTKPTLDKSAFNRAVTNGEMDAELVTQIINIKERKPWLSISEVKESNEENSWVKISKSTNRYRLPMVIE